MNGEIAGDVKRGMRFGEIVARNRKARGLTLEKLARKIGTHKGYVSGIENGKVRPPAAGITARLSKVLGLETASMLILGWAQKAPVLVRDDILRRVVDWKEYPAPPVQVTLSADDAEAFERFKAERRQGVGA